MIRYVLAVLLTVAILGLATPAIDEASTDNSERQLQTAISDIEEAAVDLETNEQVSPPEHPDPQRVLELSIPAGSLTTEGVSHFEIEPVEDVNVSIARYVLDDGTQHQEIIEQRIVYRDRTDNRTTEIGGSGVQTLRVVLLADENGEPVVVAEPPEADGAIASSLSLRAVE
ncbi:hypothetical protein D8Y22_13270 [Salinadaptatus halalkaliphilus]|uniref:DUF7311 domain-containing protein n=1 Tax=Salinadaptatus halalkaliphilus TaxID=2419781 RepID=A0A4S3TK44_9EURY|nr:hypothetical protein [Salinadaptatus halalkaliphilus]THE64376.1 hypothetical protein D8Y22_13270 [Salinadaptatus halalkaliphilus]